MPNWNKIFQNVIHNFYRMKHSERLNLEINIFVERYDLELIIITR